MESLLQSSESESESESYDASANECKPRQLVCPIHDLKGYFTCARESSSSSSDEGSGD